MLLCLDTSHGAAVALIDHGADGASSHRPPTVFARGAGDDPRRHTEVLAPLIAAVLDEGLERAGRTRADLTGLVVGTGPAPFTGLRVGLVTARTLAAALGLPVYGVSALDALARQAFDAAGEGPVDTVLVAADARRKEVYWARYASAGDDDVRLLEGPAVDRPADLVARVRENGDVPVTGRGADLYPAELGPLAAPDTMLRASAAVDPAVLGRLALARERAGTAQPTTPLYLRRPDIHTSSGRKRAS
ncbi:tRNA (adenosine(37)-N6)-threonylcarbamoyltransferase complex dimerization subunit type 1 TsaB [Pseudactinotalea sp. HY158]|uniref:tRNA (adenosine(37)-N6)-threonylcarbamoyltransferase complex dimerization subunit type 1 TsaB n=1 Tax=Pseudactinotalea sp. HY158 TaxID=2654547 RepID=UPI00129C7F38|nr:tRNA (adenosine(37)-N6)-threonylcarbamoyltransferase complex dimerization subunit type 1 TsaB [Pseudactinotalea sp. HY158]QGH70391.1 tRNA (adenosine(37)-N6)-threonylcarbamoyltransferase complex dimerization subunit type 1 TsaB [Pseudactinotalea sp. HY158]